MRTHRCEHKDDDTEYLSVAGREGGYRCIMAKYSAVGSGCNDGDGVDSNGLDDRARLLRARKGKQAASKSAVK